MEAWCGRESHSCIKSREGKLEKTATTCYAECVSLLSDQSSQTGEEFLFANTSNCGPQVRQKPLSTFLMSNPSSVHQLIYS